MTINGAVFCFIVTEKISWRKRETTSFAFPIKSIDNNNSLQLKVHHSFALTLLQRTPNINLIWLGHCTQQPLPDPKIKKGILGKE